MAKTSKTSTPLETSEQQIIVAWLRMRQIRFFSVPNGAVLGGQNRFALLAKLKSEGLLPGAPDLVLIDPAPIDGKHVVVEMKRQAGKRGGRVGLSDEQRLVIPWFEAAMWHYVLARGAESGLHQLRKLGY